MKTTELLKNQEELSPIDPIENDKVQDLDIETTLKLDNVLNSDNTFDKIYNDTLNKSTQNKDEVEVVEKLDPFTLASITTPNPFEDTPNEEDPFAKCKA
ncbi:MAG: hypothetical protein ACI4PF_03760, partial [Christensenellales bacterium]